MQPVLILEKTGGRFDVLQLQTCGQALAQLVLHPFALIIAGLDQINPYRLG